MEISGYYLPEAFCLAVNPLLYYFSPMDRVVTRVRGRFRGAANTHGWGSRFSDGLRELLRCQGEDLRNTKPEPPRDYNQREFESIAAALSGEDDVLTSKISRRWRRL